MESNDHDYQYWISRKVKISKEYNELRELKQSKLDELEQQRQIKDENTLKIESLKRKIAELHDDKSEMNPSRLINYRSPESVMNVSAPLITSGRKTFYRQYTKEFEYTLKESEDLKPNQISDKIFEHFLMISKNNSTEEPEIIHSIPKDDFFTNSAQGRALGNFAFPTGIRQKKVKESKGIEELKRLLNIKPERNGKHFVFSLKSDIESPLVPYEDRANYKMELLYCCCVVVDELIDVVVMDNNMYLFQPMCYCLVSYFPYFELNFKILFHAINAKISAERELISQHSDSYSYQQARQKIINSHCLEHTCRMISQAQVLTNMNKQIEIQGIHYDFPASPCELDTSWFCPLLFSLLRLDDVLFLLFAILQEASVIFISQNMDYLSSCVLGFQALIRPYYWPHIITPILPSSLIELLEAPVPLLAGIPKGYQLSSKKLAHLITVDLDLNTNNSKVQKPLKSSNIVHMPNMRQENLAGYYRAFSGGPCYTPNTLQLKHCRKIVDRIKMYLKRLRSNLTKIQDSVDRDNIRDYDHIVELLRAQGEVDMEFWNNFYSTQMCTNFVAEYYSLRSSYTGRTFELC